LSPNAHVDLYDRIAKAVIAEFAKPSPAMIDAAYEAPGSGLVCLATSSQWTCIPYS
jgi:hypothetical protein